MLIVPLSVLLKHDKIQKKMFSLATSYHIYKQIDIKRIITILQHMYLHHTIRTHIIFDTYYVEIGLLVHACK